MKAIFLCEKEIVLGKPVESYRRVFDRSVIEKLHRLAELDERVYTKEDVCNAPDQFADTQILFSTWGMPEFTEEEIKAIFPKLECLFYAAGSVRRFARPFINCGVKVFSAWGANGVPVAEFTTAQILLANKGFFTEARLMKEKRIDDAYALRGAWKGNYREKVGLIGCGMIGSMVAEKLKEYDLEVLAFDPFLTKERAAALNVRQVSLDTLFSTCRVISNHLANNSETQGMLTYSHFSQMPPYASFINTGRGAQVVEPDLIQALRERPDLTAILDVTASEPAELSHPFYTLPNCFMTPHIAGSLGDEVVRMADYMVTEFERYSAGQPCRYEVSMKMLETMA